MYRIKDPRVRDNLFTYLIIPSYCMLYFLVISTILYRSIGDDTFTKIGFSRSKVYALFYGVKELLLLIHILIFNRNITTSSYESSSDIPGNNSDRTKWAMSRKATIELTQ